MGFPQSCHTGVPRLTTVSLSDHYNGRPKKQDRFSAVMTVESLPGVTGSKIQTLGRCLLFTTVAASTRWGGVSRDPLLRPSDQQWGKRPGGSLNNGRDSLNSRGEGGGKIGQSLIEQPPRLATGDGVVSRGLATSHIWIFSRLKSRRHRPLLVFELPHGPLSARILPVEGRLGVIRGGWLLGTPPHRGTKGGP